MKILLLPEQYNTIKTMFKSFKYIDHHILRYLYYNSSKKELVICNGTLLRIEKMELGDKDYFFDRKDFSKTLKTSESVFVESVETNYPYYDYEKVYKTEDPEYLKQKIKEGNFFPSLNLKILQDFYNSINFSKNENIPVIFIPGKMMKFKDKEQFTIIKIYQIPDQNNEPDLKDYVFKGVISLLKNFSNTETIILNNLI